MDRPFLRSAGTSAIVGPDSSPSATTPTRHARCVLCSLKRYPRTSVHVLTRTSRQLFFWFFPPGPQGSLDDLIFWCVPCRRTSHPSAGTLKLTLWRVKDERRPRLLLSRRSVPGEWGKRILVTFVYVIDLSPRTAVPMGVGYSAPDAERIQLDESVQRLVP